MFYFIAGVLGEGGLFSSIRVERFEDMDINLVLSGLLMVDDYLLGLENAPFDNIAFSTVTLRYDVILMFL